MGAAANPLTLHASAVANGPKGLLIKGKSGTGKSTLALELIALGARLVADDQVVLHPQDGGLLMSAPDPLKGRIEARGLGILQTEQAPAFASAVVDLDQTETARLPDPRETVIAGEPLPLYHRVENTAFASMLYVLLSGGLE